MKRPPKNKLIANMQHLGSQRAVAELFNVQVDTVRAWLRYYDLDPRSFQAKTRMPDGTLKPTKHKGPKTVGHPILTNDDRRIICDCKGSIAAKVLAEKFEVSLNTIYTTWSRWKDDPSLYELWKSQPSARVVTR